MKKLLVMLLVSIMAISANYVNAQSVFDKDVKVRMTQDKNQTTYSAVKDGKVISTLSFIPKGKEVIVKANFPGSKGAVMNFYNGDRLVQSKTGSEELEDWIWIVLACLQGHAEVGSSGWSVSLSFNCLEIANSVEFQPIY